jgi:hypothetical protein
MKPVLHLHTDSSIYAEGTVYDSTIERIVKFFMRFDTKAQALSHLSGIRDNDDGFEFQLVIHSKA